MAAPVLVYVAAGAGLGHLTRACAVARHLAARDVNVRIVSHSIHSEAMRRLTGAALDHIPASAWRGEVVPHVRRLRPALVVLDTFPWGLRGEWRGVDDLRFATIARRLQVPAYLDAIAGAWLHDSPTLKRAIVCEPLSAEHESLLRASGEVTVLPGPIRFPAERLPTPVPEELSTVLRQRRIWLVVHSGPEQEVEQLVGHAEDDMRRAGGGQVVIIAPRPARGRPTFDYFPAARLYPAAFRVVTGGGYNSVAELAAFPEKRLWIPFPRRYDDQAGRLALAQVLDADTPDGGPAAASLLRAMLLS